MLQISQPLKGSGKGEYYLGLAKEDYYLNGGEPPGRWSGAGAGFLELAGEVDKTQLRRLFSGYMPDGSGSCVQNAGRDDRIIGWDLVFSAPKSVSVLWSQAPGDIRQAIQEAQAKAVQAGLDYLESVGGLTRRGRGGQTIECARTIFAVFDHGTSRAQDPQLHTHAVLLNVCVRDDGGFGSVFAREIFRHKMTAGALYRAELATQLGRLGLGIERAGDFFRIPGVSDALCDEFSKRSREIREYLAQRGESGAVAAKHAALATREVKGHVARAELFAIWCDVGRAMGWSTEDAARLIKAQRQAHDPQAALEAANEILSTRRKETFPARDLIRILAEEGQGRGLDAAAVLEAAAAFLERESVALFPRNGEASFATRTRVNGERGSRLHDYRDHEGSDPKDPNSSGDSLAAASRPIDPNGDRWFEVRHFAPFPGAWGGLKCFTVPYLAFAAKLTDRNPRFDKTLWQSATFLGTIKVRERILFPDAPSWSPFHGLKRPMIHVLPERDPLGLKGAIAKLNPFRADPEDMKRGDRVYFTRAIKLLNIVRGASGIVMEANDAALSVLLTNGRMVQVPESLTRFIRVDGESPRRRFPDVTPEPKQGFQRPSEGLRWHHRTEQNRETQDRGL